MKVHRGKNHKYLGMLLDFSHANQCRVTMIDYLDEIVVAYDKALKELSDGFIAINSLTAMVSYMRPFFFELRDSLITFRIFVR